MQTSGKEYKWVRVRVQKEKQGKKVESEFWSIKSFQNPSEKIPKIMHLRQMNGSQRIEMCTQSLGVRAALSEPCDLTEPQRYAVLTRDVKSSQVIFDCEPYSFILSSDHRLNRCSYCFVNSGLALMTCARCGFARYCDKECQRLDWHIGHKHECQQVTVLRNEGCSAGPLDEILLLMRTYVNAYNKNPLENQSCSTACDGTVKCGASHVRDLCVNNEISAFDNELSVHTIAEAIKRVSICLKQPQKQLLGPISRLYASFRSNNFAILNTLFQSLGAGVYPHAALLNHSCCPNTLLTYIIRPGKAPILRCIALKDMRRGEELTHCYVDATQSTAMRLKSLHIDYGFKCTCQRCIQPSLVLKETQTEALRAKLYHLAAEPIDVFTFIGTLTEEQSASIQTLVDEMQSRGFAQDALRSEILDLQACVCQEGQDARNAMHCAVNEKNELIGIFLQRLVDLDRKLKELEDLSGPFCQSLYAVQSKVFTEVLAEALLIQSLVVEGMNGLADAHNACEKLAVKLCSKMCAYLVLTLRSFPFHPLLGLQLLTLGQLSHDERVLTWALGILRQCNGQQDSGQFDEMIRAAEARGI